MDAFVKNLLYTIAGLFIALPLVAGWRGWGISSERNAEIMKATAQACAEHERLSDGTCRRGHRSYYHRRGFGGGYSGGK